MSSANVYNANSSVIREFITTCQSACIVQSIYTFDPSQIATESFSSPFISETYTNQHIKSLEKSKKGKIQNFY